MWLFKRGRGLSLGWFWPFKKGKNGVVYLKVGVALFLRCWPFKAFEWGRGLIILGVASILI